MGRVRVAGIAAAVFIALITAECGGGGGSAPTPPSPSNVSVVISPASSTVAYGGAQQFTATVTGATNTAVTWSVSSAGGTGSAEIGAISSSGLYTAPAATTVPPEMTSQLVSVTGGNTASNVDIAVPPLNSVDSVTVTATSQADTSKSASAAVALSGLSITAMGKCIPDSTNPGTLNCTYGSTGTQVSPGQTAYLLVVGYGILPGTIYTISGSDVVVTQPSASQFQKTSNGVPAVYFQIVVSPTAALGPRNLIVRNSGNELASFIGGLSITQ